MCFSIVFRAGHVADHVAGLVDLMAPVAASCLALIILYSERNRKVNFFSSSSVSQSYLL